MKLYSTNGKGVGKKGSSVFSINHGVQIEREYNGSVHNPNTAAQIAQRARFKLASQISVALADVIAIPRKGILSPRNRWTKHNIGYFYGNEEGAQVTYELLQLTLGTLALPAFEVVRKTGPNDSSLLAVQFVDKVYPTYDRIVWNFFSKNDDGTLMLVKSVVDETIEDAPYAGLEIEDIPGNILVYAYGIHDRNADARARYGSYNVETGADVARLVVNRRITASNYAFSVTQGATLAAGQTSNVVPSSTKSVLTLTCSGNGAIKQGDNTICPANSTRTLSVEKSLSYNLNAVAGDDWHFVSWSKQGENTVLSTQELLAVSGAENANLVARFDVGGGLE